eukprot:CAMPEP_0175135100 /NCGR_PEP_ID=MMETSP0087-20121206/8533_1 /TAXON_ID=136419 /ORGANISM="Unknown Unknown, Strain D1" /LENGTH=519 /DNA_ID=CAMNT_0016417709 /DNA_START=61 /DNA_END=1620 /DNA_ORIENTATION=+
MGKDASQLQRVYVGNLSRWNASLTFSPSKPESKSDEDTDKKEEWKKCAFPYNEELNKKIILWQGDLCCLVVDAIVSTTNEKLNEKGGLAERVTRLAGPKMSADFAALESCSTGDAVMSEGHARHVIHTVGPRYTLKYQTAAENALHGCYRRSLELLKEEGLSSIGFCVVNTKRKGYPRKPAAHIAFRTVRRFLEKYGGSITDVVFCVAHEHDLAAYQEVLPLYFPRSPQEHADSYRLLPDDIGNEIGETVVEGRSIRLSQGPTLDPSQPNVPPAGSMIYQHPPVPFSGNGGERSSGVLLKDESFIHMQDNPDEVRKKRDSNKPKAERIKEENEFKYKTILSRAENEYLEDLAQLKFIYQSGVDHSGRPIIIFVASLVPAKTVDLERIMLYIIKVMDPIVESDFNIIYVHTNFRSQNKFPLPWLREVYATLDRRYKKNVKRIFVIHATWWVKLVMSFAKPFVRKKVWNKLFYVEKLSDIYEFFERRAVHFPDTVVTYDKENASSSKVTSIEQKAANQEGL